MTRKVRDHQLKIAKHLRQHGLQGGAHVTLAEMTGMPTRGGISFARVIGLGDQPAVLGDGT
ncbi:MAG: hypothetical protein M3436_18250 [Pseudomonadota bacterium]|nr:hypothetical protein [Pseudomonadota bacterium]